MAICMASGGLVPAQGHRNPAHRANGQQAQSAAPPDPRDNHARQEERGDNRARPGASGDSQTRQQERRDFPHRGRQAGLRDQGGADPKHAYRLGSRLSFAYRSRQYVVGHWRRHSLAAPRRGHHWAQVGGDYILIAIAIGIFVKLQYGH